MALPMPMTSALSVVGTKGRTSTVLVPALHAKKNAAMDRYAFTKMSRPHLIERREIRIDQNPSWGDETCYMIQNVRIDQMECKLKAIRSKIHYRNRAYADVSFFDG